MESMPQNDLRTSVYLRQRKPLNSFSLHKLKSIQPLYLKYVQHMHTIINTFLGFLAEEFCYSNAYNHISKLDLNYSLVPCLLIPLQSAPNLHLAQKVIQIFLITLQLHRLYYIFLVYLLLYYRKKLHK